MELGEIFEEALHFAMICAIVAVSLVGCGILFGLMWRLFMVGWALVMP